MKRTMWIGILVLVVGFLACKQDVERQRILKVYGADWSGDGRVLVLGRFTDVRVTYGWLWGASYDTLKNQDVMLWVDPVSRAVDSVWVIHEPGGVIGGYDLWRDPSGRGWWLGGRLYDASFRRIVEELPCGGRRVQGVYPKGDTVYYSCFTGAGVPPDTVKRKILGSGVVEDLFTYPVIGLIGVDN